MAKRNFDASVDSLIRAISLLVRRVRAAAAAHELSLSESAVMARLDREGPATIAALARAESVKPQSMGTTIAALEERGLAERKPHPTDGRQVLVELTGHGAAVRKSAGDAKRTWLANAVSELSEEDRQTLFRAGEIIGKLIEGTHASDTNRQQNGPRSH